MREIRHVKVVFALICLIYTATVNARDVEVEDIASQTFDPEKPFVVIRETDANKIEQYLSDKSFLGTQISNSVLYCPWIDDVVKFDFRNDNLVIRGSKFFVHSRSALYELDVSSLGAAEFGVATTSIKDRSHVYFFKLEFWDDIGIILNYVNTNFETGKSVSGRGGYCLTENKT